MKTRCAINKFFCPQFYSAPIIIYNIVLPRNDAQQRAHRHKRCTPLRLSCLLCHFMFLFRIRLRKKTFVRELGITLSILDMLDSLQEQWEKYLSNLLTIFSQNSSKLFRCSHLRFINDNDGRPIAKL